MADTNGIYFELSETLAEKLEERIDELDVSKREYFESYVRDDTEHITLDDPRAELAEIERQLEAAQEELEELRGEKKDVRDSIKSLEQRREEMEERLDDSGLVTAGSYDDAIDALTERAVEEGVAEVGRRVERVSEDWARDPQTVCRDVYERSIRVTGHDVSIKGPFGGGRVPDNWETEWPDYEEAVSVLADDVLACGVLSAGSLELKRLDAAYDVEFEVIAGDLLDEMDGVDLVVVETEMGGEYPSADDAPDADLVVGDWIADQVGIDS